MREKEFFLSNYNNYDINIIYKSFISRLGGTKDSVTGMLVVSCQKILRLFLSISYTEFTHKGNNLKYILIYIICVCDCINICTLCSCKSFQRQKEVVRCPGNGGKSDGEQSDMGTGNQT